MPWRSSPEGSRLVAIGEAHRANGTLVEGRDLSAMWVIVPRHTQPPNMCPHYSHCSPNTESYSLGRINRIRLDIREEVKRGHMGRRWIDHTGETDFIEPPPLYHAVLLRLKSLAKSLAGYNMPPRQTSHISSCLAQFFQALPCSRRSLIWLNLQGNIAGDGDTECMGREHRDITIRNF